MDRIGLCGSCAYVRIVESGRGSRFYMCLEAQRDATLKKYPALPRVACHAYKLNHAPGVEPGKPEPKRGA